MIKYIQSGSCEVTELDGEWIILDSDKLTVTKLNGTGGYCWSLLNKIQSSKSLAQFVIDKFSPAEDINVIKQDIEGFLESLHQCGLVKYVNG